MEEGEKVKNELIKVTSDLIENKEALNFIKERSKKNYVVVVPGGGSQINEAFKKAGLEIKFGVTGRETNFKGRQISRDILEENQRLLQNKFIKKKNC